ncbi:hypothetical protein C5B42_00775 [Candidatus Cerribacteria bacterium 'Amazon FNV 2010 28 9']|uniref:Translation initiation factor IF-2 n=1 Tax=Candidatus Cerribacteria bacterium 'Amazon FNV 2010 28 9' TaxID=2081795 RepID=A0A317JRE2_9BACT|nr:MAG: hypothetical protein C5B42_00775 [Candidatus Cerribacteria bacterium 'Amazon FNV 2010 28 9']
MDAIRSAHVADREAGGITQHIGAYQITHNDRVMTFIDTPGHAAFSKMRSRGATVTDIVVLVVAADDGVMPQTIESIQHIKQAGVQFLVAINKIDSPNANPIHVKTQLAEHEVFVEGFGGSTSVVEVSAKTKQGIPELLEMLLLMADVAELKADPDGEFEGVVIESGKDARRGVSATVLVKNGSLKVKSPLFATDAQGKVRSMMDANGKMVTQAIPAMPVVVLGFETVPAVGSVVKNVPIEHQAVVAQSAQASTGEEKLKFMLKADVAGSLEAIKGALGDSVELMAASVGDVSESDVLLAETMKAKILGFNVNVPKSVEQLATTQNVKIKTYKIIYELLEDIEKQVYVFTHPGMDEEEVGTAEIVALFDIRGDKIAGCKVKTGEVKKGMNIFWRIKRGEEVVFEPRLKSIKQGKLDVESVNAPLECGIVFRGNPSFQVGDVIVCYTKKEV